MAAHLPVVTDGHLDLPSPANTVQIAFASPAWFAWLELPDTRSFTFQDAGGTFTARKERRQQAGAYWIAYRKGAGKLRNVYLGKSAQLTWERLTTAAGRLAVQQPLPTEPQARPNGAQAEAALPQLAHLLTTKLSVPPLRPSAIPRPHLLDELAAGLHGKLTLISAPAGFGKTTLLSAWCATLQDRAVPLAWVSLDAGDADPTQFWTYVTTALDTLQPGSGSQALALLQAPQPPPIAALLAPLLSRLNTLPGDAVLVLDDYHVIATPSIHQDVAFLLDHLPPRLHLVIATRADPALALSRLRASGTLTELRAADLRFTPDEAASFLTEAMQFPLSAADVVALEERTEGWIAGLQFAALAMRNRTDLTGFVQAFTGSHRFVVDYLAEEVFTRQPAHLQAFLLQTAILDRMCGALCDAVLLGDLPDAPPHQPGSPSAREQAYSQTLLDELERANLFLVPLDDERRWYRYHHLFADVLRQRLTSGASRDAVRALHRRAAAWYEHAGLIREALQHALAGEDWERAAGMIEAHAMRFIFRGQVRTVLGWLEMLPDVLVRVRSRLGLIYALALGDTFQAEAAETRLQDVERAVHAETPPDQVGAILGEVALTRAMLARSLGHLAHCVALSQRALDLLPTSEVAQRSSARLNLARAFLVSGDVTHGNERLARDVIVPARASGNLFAALSAFTNLARLQVLQGRLRAAAATYAQAEELAPEISGLRMLGSASASFYIGLGDLHREWNDLEQAEQHLAQAMDLISGPLTIDADVVTQGYITLARVQQARAESGRAGTTLAELAALAYERKFAGHLITRGTAA